MRRLILVSITVLLLVGLQKAGKGLEGVHMRGLPDKWNSWGSGFITTERWIKTIYHSPGA